MKSIITLFVILSFNLKVKSQLLRGMDKFIANKYSYKMALRNVEEKGMRFFYKKSNTGYIFTGTTRDLDADNKSFADIKLLNTGDTIEAKIYTYQLSSKSFVLSSTVHGKDGKERLYYKRIKGDVYIALEDLDRKKDSAQLLVSYLLFNKKNGLYYHRFIYQEERKLLNKKQENYVYLSNGQVNTLHVNTTYGARFYYVNGSGLYKKTKKNKLSKQELERSKNPKENFDSIVIVASNN